MIHTLITHTWFIPLKPESRGAHLQRNLRSRSHNTAATNKHSQTVAMANMHQAGYGIEIPLELMTCLLRLRCQPPVPYPMIARILQEVHPAATVSYTPESAPWVTSPDPNKRLEAHLEQVYDNLEKRQSETWKAARGFDEAALKVLLRNTELDAKFGIMGIKELTLQIKWKKDGDCRLDSEAATSPN